MWDDSIVLGEVRIVQHSSPPYRVALIGSGVAKGERYARRIHAARLAIRAP